MHPRTHGTNWIHWSFPRREPPRNLGALRVNPKTPLCEDPRKGSCETSWSPNRNFQTERIKEQQVAAPSAFAASLASTFFKGIPAFPRIFSVFGKCVG